MYPVSFVYHKLQEDEPNLVFSLVFIIHKANKLFPYIVSFLDITSSVGRSVHSCSTSNIFSRYFQHISFSISFVNLSLCMYILSPCLCTILTSNNVNNYSSFYAVDH